MNTLKRLKSGLVNGDWKFPQKNSATPFMLTVTQQKINLDLYWKGKRYAMEKYQLQKE